MTNLEIYNRAFITNFKVSEEELPDLKYLGHPKWHSVGHMALVADLEEAFDIMLSTPDLLDFSSYLKGKEVLKRYGVTIEDE